MYLIHIKEDFMTLLYIRGICLLKILIFQNLSINNKFYDIKVVEKAMLRNRYDQTPRPAQEKKQERNTNT